MNIDSNKNKKSGSGNQIAKKGFTLIEMLVAVALFSIVMLISVAAILSIIGGNRKAQAVNSVANNVNFAIESMIRDIKTGYNYKCLSFTVYISNTSAPGECTPTVAVGTDADPFTFTSTLAIEGVGQPVEYKYAVTDGVGTIYKTYSPAGSGGTPVTVPLTSPKINIKRFEMYVKNPEAGTMPKAQPSVFLILEGESVADGNELTQQVSTFSLQTYISQRLLNL